MEFNLTQIALKSLEKEFGPLPTQGFLAGGAVANRLFELKWGQKMPVNDLDIFYFHPEKLDISQAYKNKYIVEDKKCFHAELKDDIGVNTYGDFFTQTKTTQGYIVNEVKREGMLNEIFIKASHLDPMLVLRSFDLNCTQIGIDLATGKVYSTKEWDDFIENKKIQITSLHTPSHTLLRIFKKAEEFGLTIEEGELELIRYSLDYPLGFQRNVFAQKYKNLWDKYGDLIQEKNFKLVEKDESSKFLATKIGKEIGLWSIRSSKQNNNFFNLQDSNNYFPGWDFNLDSVINNSSKLIWSYRNIYPQPHLYPIWDQLHFLWEIENISFDKILEISPEKIKFLNKLYGVSPTLIKHLQETDSTFERHLDYIERIWRTFEPAVALSLCWKLNIPIDWTHQDELLMELSVRLFSNQDKVIKQATELAILWRQGISNI